MAVITLSQAQLSFGHVPLLDKAEFSLEAGERIGLIGRNGTGKSSLFKVLCGFSKLDDGLLAIQQGLKIAHVEQEPHIDGQMTVFEAVAEGLKQAQVLLAEYDTITLALNDHSDEATLERLHELQTALDACDAWSINNRVETVLEHLNLDSSLIVSELSGGTQKRVALARALVSAPDVLLLDEPTNHLDFTSIKWLENMLQAFKGSVLFITHDRRFLDNVSTRILELDRGQLYSYPGNFSTYQIRKAEQLEIEAFEHAKFDKFLAQEEVWIRKGVEARRTRNEGRVRRLEELRRTRSARRDVQGQVKLDISTGERTGKIIAELTNVEKNYGSRCIVKDFTSTILRGDKVGLIGPNGIGKTTLLKIILGEIAPDNGSVKLGTKQEIAYFDQMRSQLDENTSLADTITPGSDWVEINGQRKHVMSYLGDFLFAPERARSPVKSLSGGERNRLLLARLFAKPANVLVLDEPTNDLDIDTLELLEELLENYSGTVFLVSHDRSFLDNVVTQVIVSEGNGNWREYVGGYSDWEQQRPTATNPPNIDTTAASASKAPKPEEGASTLAATAITKSKAARKLSFAEQRELQALPELIANLETEQAQLLAKTQDKHFYKLPADEIKQINTRLLALENSLSDKLERWTFLESSPS